MKYIKFKNDQLVELSQADIDDIDRRSSEQENDKLSALINSIRIKRDEFLEKTDWLSLRAIETNVIDDNLNVYRQKLRDIPQQVEFPENVVWPTFN